MKYHAQQEITEPSKKMKVCICNLCFKDLCLQYKPNSLGRSPTDRVGKSGSAERWTRTVGFGVFLAFVDNKKNQSWTAL